MLAPLVTVDVRVGVLRLVEGLANTAAVILQEITVHLRLELACIDASGASLGPIGQKVNCDFWSRMKRPVVNGWNLPARSPS